MTLPIIPNPPTDNLYKFCALTGTIIFILSLYFPARLYYEVEEKLDVADFKIKVTEHEAEYYRTKAELLNRIVDNSIAYQKGPKHHDKNKLDLNYSEDEIKQMRTDLNEIKKNTGIKQAETAMLVQQIRRLKTYHLVIGLLSLFTIAVGYFLGIYGYVCWYHRIQKYQDMNIRNALNSNDTKTPSQ